MFYLYCSTIRHEYSWLIVGDEEEWDQQCGWHSALMSGLDKLDVCMDHLQQDNEKWTSQKEDWSANLHVMVRTIVSRLISDITVGAFFFGLK